MKEGGAPILGVDASRLLGQRTGVGRMLEAVLAAFGGLEHPFGEIRLYTPAPLPRGLTLPAEAREVLLPSRLGEGLWRQVILPRAHGRAGLLLCPSYVVPLFARSPALLVHHGSYEGHPAAFSFGRRWRARLVHTLSARRARAIATVSEHSRRDVLRFYGVPAEKVRVIPEGVDLEVYRPLDDAPGLAAWRRRVLGDDRPYFLYVGKDTRRRRLGELTEAFARLERRRGLGHRLLFVGFELAGSRVREAAERAGVADAVHAVGFAEPAELALAYNAAEALVYPSLYEGFGMPVLEAMACGTPAIALDRTAFPEFAAGVALLLEDAEVATLERGLERALDDREWRRHARVAGPARAAEYAWPLVARRYLEWISEHLEDGARGDSA